MAVMGFSVAAAGWFFGTECDGFLLPFKRISLAWQILLHEWQTVRAKGHDMANTN